MKIQIHLKDSDTLLEAIEEAVKELQVEGLSEEELETVRQKRVEEYDNLASDWFEYSEYVTLEFDTEVKTMRVMTREELN